MTPPNDWKKELERIFFADNYADGRPVATLDALEDFVDKLLTSRDEALVEYIESLKRTDEYHMSHDHAYDEALQAVIDHIKRV